MGVEPTTLIHNAQLIESKRCTNDKKRNVAHIGSTKLAQNGRFTRF